MALKKVIYLSVEQYNELMTNGSVIIDGVTKTLDSDNIYLCPAKATYTAEEVDALIAAAGGKSYAHHIKINWGNDTQCIFCTIISSQATAFTLDDLKNYIPTDGNTISATGKMNGDDGAIIVLGLYANTAALCAYGVIASSFSAYAYVISETNLTITDLVKEI